MQKFPCCQRQVALRRACAELARFWRKKNAQFCRDWSQPKLSCTQQSCCQEAHARYAILDFKSVRIHVRIHVRMCTYACVHSLARSLRQKKIPLRETGAMQCFDCVLQHVEHTYGHPQTNRYASTLIQIIGGALFIGCLLRGAGGPNGFAVRMKNVPLKACSY